MALQATTPGVQHGERVPALDLLRLVAVLGVVLFHYGFRGPTGFGNTYVALPGLSPVARYGFLGVPIFFIISGFVIAYSAEGRTAVGFAIARIARIYPTFLICMTLTFVAVLAFGAPEFATSFREWMANLVIAAPALHQPYMDSAYWSLVVEVTFYGWVTLLIATGLFARRIDFIVLVWLWISMLNEMTIDARAVEWIFLADDSGFFAAGLLFYEIYKGRRDGVLLCLLAAAIGTAVFQAVHNLGWLRGETDMAFDDWTVAAVCLVSILAIFLAIRIRHLPLRSGMVLAIGGMTYPFYLLHQQLGYALLNGSEAAANWLAPLIVLAIALLSLAVWRFAERPAQRFTKRVLTDLAGRLGQATALPHQGGAERVGSSR